MSNYEKKIPVLDSGFVQYIDHMGDDAAIPQAARVSYSKGTKTARDDETLLRFLMRHEHYSPFAMCQVKLYVRLPIFVHNQWVRHQNFHWNVMSGRYSVMPDEKWTPKIEEIRGQGSGNKQVGNGDLQPSEQEAALMLFNDAYRVAQENYEDLVGEGKVCREQARSVLPMGQYTEAFVTANLGDWMRFLKQRLDSHAQAEIRVYAEAVLEILSDLFPIAIQAFKDYQLNSVRFSAQEMIIVRALLAGLLGITSLEAGPLGWRPKTVYDLDDADEIANAFEDILPNKREREEFLAKVKRQ